LVMDSTSAFLPCPTRTNDGRGVPILRIFGKDDGVVIVFNVAAFGIAIDDRGLQRTVLRPWAAAASRLYENGQGGHGGVRSPPNLAVVHELSGSIIIVVVAFRNFARARRDQPGRLQRH
jgi:hypothetical protein